MPYLIPHEGKIYEAKKVGKYAQFGLNFKFERTNKIIKLDDLHFMKLSRVDASWDDAFACGPDGSAFRVMDDVLEEELYDYILINERVDSKTVRCEVAYFNKKGN
ncbi:MAG: hypothetical protein ABIB43_04020 [archaeon]